jgi:hypothetical protein
MKVRRAFSRGRFSHDRALTIHRLRVTSLQELVMSLILLFLLLVLVWRAVRSAWRLWSALPNRNTDFGLVMSDLGGRP